jgi:hypothetical protein
MNGYLDVAKEDWVFDINASKELEPELEFMVMAGVPINTAVGLLSQPMVREYLARVKYYNSPYAVAKGKKEGGIENVNFAKYEATLDILNKYTDLLVGKDKLGNPITKRLSTAEIVASAQSYLDDKNIEFTEEGLKARAKKKEATPSDIASFFHFLEVQSMAKANTYLKLIRKRLTY